MRKTMVESTHPQLSVRRQCELLAVNRNRLEDASHEGSTPLSEADASMVRRMDEVHLEHPELGARRLKAWLCREGYRATRRRVAHLMKHMGLEAIYRKPRTSIPNPKGAKYPYLLKERKVEAADEVWCADITYIPMRRGFAYLVAVMDWRTRAVVSWKLSNTLEGAFCVQAFEEALKKAGKAPEIFNTDQGSQFTSDVWIKTVEKAGVRVSMDGKGRWMDNVFIERLWRSVKYEGVYLWAPQTVHELERLLEKWFLDYNRLKPHQALSGLTPWQVYRPEDPKPWERAA
jgi:putative transposase